MQKVKVLLKELDKGSWGYDVRILAEDASVADYLDSLNDFQQEKVAPCDGCSNCCWERVPLTAPDVAAYGNELFAGAAATQPVRRFVERYGLVYAQDGVVDIIIRRHADSACVFLDRQKQRCQHHRLRSMVCQSYVCLPASQRAVALREQIVNAGENELIRQYHLEHQDQEPVIHEGQGPVQWSAYEGKGFRDKTSFDQVLIKDVVDADLFERLQRPE